MNIFYKFPFKTAISIPVENYIGDKKLENRNTFTLSVEECVSDYIDRHSCSSDLYCFNNDINDETQDYDEAIEKGLP